jgi:hypothetical protein
MPSSEIGSEVFKNFALNCWPWVRSLIQSPVAVTHSPAEITAACPITVTSSRWPRALIRREASTLVWEASERLHLSARGFQLEG